MRLQDHYCNRGVEEQPERGLLGLVGCFEGRDTPQSTDRRRHQRHCTNSVQAGKIKVERSEDLHTVWPPVGANAGIHLIPPGPCAPTVSGWAVARR